METKKIFMAATGQHVGKTSMTLGLVSLLRERGFNVGYCKPVGQQYVEIDGKRADKDAVVLASMLGLPLDPDIHSPIIIGGGDTEKYLKNPCPEKLNRRILDAASELEKRHEVIVFEGTGHPGVGSVVDHSNADVASLLGAGVIIVAEGGIGNTIDRLCLSKALFDRPGVEIIGTIINKVKPAKMKKVREALQTGLARKGLLPLGLVPFEETLVYPRLEHIKKAVGADVISGVDGMKKTIRWPVFGTVIDPESTPDTEEILLVTPADQIDLLLESVARLRMKKGADWRIGGLLLTAGKFIPEEIIPLFDAVGIPVLSTPMDTYTVAARLHDLVAKIDPDSQDKIETVKKLFRDHVGLRFLTI